MEKIFMREEIKIREERISPAEYISFLRRTDLGSQYPKERFQERISKLVNNVTISLVARNRNDLIVGVLFGLNLYRYDFTGILMHAEHLEAALGVGPHTISVPRLRSADDINPDDFSNGIDDDTFEKIVAVLRVAVPYTGMIISTRESQKTREKVLKLGISQISGGSRTSVGGYVEPVRDDSSAQFDVSDTRTLDEVVKWLMELGYIPSFCTACYRAGRTGDRFMSLLKSGQIVNCCQPNALMTLKEYLEDYAAEDTKRIGEELIAREILTVPNENVRNKAMEYLKEMNGGKRDFRF